ncbi:MAG: hypothetical protein GC159_05460 [Phycisphaera sp.]|nr:hypothetical protein [Phycisphaera sp.]
MAQHDNPIDRMLSAKHEAEMQAAYHEYVLAKRLEARRRARAQQTLCTTRVIAQIGTVAHKDS